MIQANEHSNRRDFARRGLLIAAAAALPAVSGCSTNTVHETVADMDTDTLENAALAMRGFAILSVAIGPRLIPLPAPGVRVLAVFLIVSGVATKLAIEYLDVELRQRHFAEALSEEEAKAIETDLAVKFHLENGNTEQVQLGANQYA